MIGQATTKANPVTFFWIESPADFTACMEACAAVGYSGNLTSTVTDEGIQWSLVLNSLAQMGVEVKVGQVLRWDERQLIVYASSDAFLALHNLS